MCFFYKSFGGTVLLLLVQLSTIAQEHQLLLRTPDGNPIKYMPILCEKRQFHIMSDAYGRVLLDSKKYQPEDTLIFRSMFYQEMKIPFRELVKRKELILQPTVIELDDITVYSPLLAEKLVREMAIFFSKNYVKDYASSVLHLRTIECNGRYREFTGLQGVFFSLDFNQLYNKLSFNDKSSLTWLPSTVMRSDPFVATTDQVLSESYAFLPPQSPISKFSKESMKIEYHDYPDQKALIMKRALEIYSPLNPAQLKHFSYSINGSYKKGSEIIYIIHFQTKDQSFPKQTRIYGEGMIYYNTTTKIAEKIVMENHQDQYTMFPRWSVDSLLPSATHHTIEVVYTCQERQIFTRSVRLNVMWVDPQVDDRFYMISLNSRRNPIRNSLEEFEYYEFDDFVILNKNKKRQILPYLFYIARDRLYYNAPFDSNVWEKVTWTGIDKARLFTELSLSDRSLLQQAEKNGTDLQFYYGEFNPTVQNLYQRVPHVYRILHEDRK